ncbi:MAG: aspartate ammonia-lyase [Thaumarchaeota archaeon S13]|nr:MAG: aspartate ammonia-lyase [Thaumarchaeota archaeon S13]
MRHRTDTDSLGEVRVPHSAYYGPFTARAIAQYTVTGRPSREGLVRAFVMTKRAAAAANMRVGALDKRRGRAIVRACDTVLAGAHMGDFAVDAINSGAGTALNMNTNEVIANVALEILGRRRGEYSHLHPNDHVNMSQSSNDTFPTAMHVAALHAARHALPAIDMVVASLRKRARAFASHKKIGRTHLMDALPVTLGAEFGAYAVATRAARDAIAESMKPLAAVALGGTAVGTGANAPRGYRRAAISELSRVSGLRLRPEADMQYALQSRQAIAGLSSAMRGLAVELGRVSNDIRLMASGPVAGISELSIPAVHAGSSIMPGKVNPSLAECMNMVCLAIVGNDATVSGAASAGQFELNVMLPVMIDRTLDSLGMMAGLAPKFAANLLDGLGADRAAMRARIEASPVIVTLLAPKIGYQRAAALFKESLATGRTIRDLAVSGGIATNAEIDALFR